VEKFGNDVFANAASIAGMCIGDEVEFGIRLDAEGRPVAVNVRWAGESASAGVGGAVAGRPKAQSNKGFGRASLVSRSQTVYEPAKNKSHNVNASPLLKGLSMVLGQSASSSAESSWDVGGSFYEGLSMVLKQGANPRKRKAEDAWGW